MFGIGKIPSEEDSPNKGASVLIDYVDDSGKTYTPAHYAIGICNLFNGDVVYGDSKGWEAPLRINETIYTILHNFVDRNLSCSIKHCHFNAKLPVVPENNHICVEECAKIFPLQNRSSECGLSVIVIAVLAALDENKFSVLCSNGLIQDHEMSYLKNISEYLNFIRLTLVKWLMECRLEVTDLIAEIPASVSSTDVQVSVQEELSGNQNVIDENDEDDEFQQSKRSSSASMKENESNRNLIDENDYAVYHCYRELSDAVTAYEIDTITKYNIKISPKDSTMIPIYKVTSAPSGQRRISNCFGIIIIKGIAHLLNSMVFHLRS